MGYITNPPTVTGKPGEPPPYGAMPQTGDTGSNGAWYMAIMIFSSLCLIGCAAFLVATRKKPQPVDGNNNYMNYPGVR